MTGRFLRRPEVLRSTGLSNRTMTRKIAAGLFPAGVQMVDADLKVWPEGDIEAWKAAQLAGVSWGVVQNDPARMAELSAA